MGKVIAILLAAGKGSRMHSTAPKQYLKLGDLSALAHNIILLNNNNLIDAIQIVINSEHQALYDQVIKELPFLAHKLLKPVFGGERRQDSSRIGLLSVKNLNPKYVLIHDAARPFINDNLIGNLIKELENNKAVIPILPIQDTIKKIESNKVISSVSRDKLYLAHTPQVFLYETILSAHEQCMNIDSTDDAELCEKIGIKVKAIDSTAKNFKITTARDLEMAEYLTENDYETRIGMGFDVHRFEDTNNSIFTTIPLAGVKIPHNQAVIAHSDGDVVLHALCDALFGAMGAGDIGIHFPPTDDQWKNVDSVKFVRFALDMLKEKKGKIINIDVTIITEVPKIKPYRLEMQTKLAEILSICPSRVNIKATTTEKLGFTGRKEGIAAQVIANIKLSVKSLSD